VKKLNSIPKLSSLRQKVEEQLIDRQSETELQISVEAVLKIIDELELKQLELEITNASLVKAKQQSEITKAKYVELYDYAPMSYFTLTQSGKIIDLNLSGANLLGKQRSLLIENKFSSFVSTNSKITFTNFLEKLFRSKVKESCEIILTTDFNKPIYISLSGIINKNEKQCLLTAIDITNRKEKEESLKAQEHFISAITETTPAIIYVYDMESNSNVFVNTGIERLLGYSKKEIQNFGENLFAHLIHPDDQVNVIEFQKNILEATNKSIFEIEYRIKHRNGNWIILNSYESVFLRNSDGTVKQKIGVAIDITERKKMEEEIHKKEHLLRLFVEHSPAAIAMFDLEMNYIAASNRYVTDFGIENSNLIGRCHYEIFPEIPERWKAIHKRCMAGEIIKTDEDKFLRSSGKLDWTKWEIHPWYENENQIGGIILFIEVITERKQAQEEYDLVHRNLVMTMENMTDAFVSLDKDWRYTYVNNDAGIILNRDPDSLIGEKISTEFLDGVGKPFKLEYEKAMQEQIPVSFEEFYSPYEKWFENRIYPTPNGLSIFFTDITERKNSELKLQEYTSELGKLNTDKDQFISILAHDLKNPFFSMLGFLTLLSESVDEFSIEEIKAQIDIVKNTAENTYSLLDDILIWSQAQSGKLPFEPHKLILNTVCSEVIAGMKLIADNKKIAIHYLNDEDINIGADADMLKTILRNLISNALKFTNNGGIIEISAEQTDSAVTISVKDNGNGIDPSLVSKLFDLTETKTTRGTKGETGTGLGLVLCKEFVEKHNGNLWVESELGKGSNFRFTIPREK
jgi:PAS domain S-box-containing protein